MGKIALLDWLTHDGEQSGLRPLRAEAPEGRSLRGMLAPERQLVLTKLSRAAKAGDLARRALTALAGFVKALEVSDQGP